MTGLTQIPRVMRAGWSQPDRLDRDLMVGRSPHGADIPYTPGALQQDVRRLRGAWRRYRKCRDRDAIYGFLGSIFEITAIWVADGKAVARTRQVLDLRGCGRPRRIEPFSTLITAIAHPRKVDDRTISKWTRVLRYAAAFKVPEKPLAAFIKRRGGINACSLRYTRRLGRLAIGQTAVGFAHYDKSKSPLTRSPDANAINKI